MKKGRRAADGYSNAAAFLGEDSPLLSAGTFLRSGLTSDPERLTAMYRESWLTMRIIDMPSEDMTRAWYRLTPPCRRKPFTIFPAWRRSTPSSRRSPTRSAGRGCTAAPLP